MHKGLSKGFSLLEMIAVLATLPLFLTLVSRAFMLLSREIPKSDRLVADQALVQQILGQIQRDLDEAQALVPSDDDKTLLIQKAGGLVAYRLEGGKVTKTLVQTTAGSPEPMAEWGVPAALLRWRLLGQAGALYAVEIHSAMIDKVPSGEHERLAGNRVFFVGHQPEEALP
jgi:hypothetical protein